MPDITRIKALTEETHHAVSTGDRELAERVGWELCEVFSAELGQGCPVSEYTPELARLQFDALSAILEIHIMRGDGFDIGIRASQIARDYRELRDSLPNWSKEDWAPVEEVMKHCVTITNEFFDKNMRGEEEVVEKRSPECQCLLCRKRPATKTGSHMIPHFLIARTFSYDGSTSRDKVVVETADLSKGKTGRYFGHEVNDDTVNELLGRSFSDEEIEEEMEKPNALTRDYYFCDDCEKRFGVIESYYSEILDGRLKSYALHIPYLFWLSVAWRMSVGGMGFKMTPEHDEKLRKVLDHCLALSRDEIESRKSKFGHCAYSLYRADDTRDEALGILAPHTPTKPYMALIGNLLLNFYTSSSAAVSFSKQHGMPPEELNFGTEPEKIGVLDFIEFWQVKRQILDMVWEDERSIWNLGAKRNQTLSRFSPVPGGADAAGGDMPSWMNTTNDHVIMAPLAIQKIEKWLEDHPDRQSAEEISQATGYSLEELAVILSYWEDKCEALKEKQKRTQELGPLFHQLLDLYQ